MRLEPWHVIVLIVIVLLVFGSKRLPDMTRSVGRSMRIFKSEIEEMRHDDDKKAPNAPAPTVEPLTGRVVDTPAPRSSAASEKTTDELR